MRAEPALAETHELQLPHELVSALNSRPHGNRTDYRIEALRPSLLGRLLEKLLGRRS
ncbi:MAG TPA: hypothetical protein VIY54_06700 [Steroidobacteraceae bacterium]